MVSPGVKLMFGSIGGLKDAHTPGHISQAWKAGDETIALRRQLQAMPDGGVFAITIPEAPSLPALPVRAGVGGCRLPQTRQAESQRADS